MKMFFLIIMGAYLGGNIYIYIRLMQTLSGVSLFLRIMLSFLFWAMALMLLVSMLMRDVQIPTSIAKAMFNLGSIWMVFTLYMVLALTVFDCAKIFVPTIRWGFIYALGMTTALLIYGYYNYRHPKIEYIDITLDKPLSGNEVRIAAISDVHLGNGTDKVALKRYIKLINSQKPDLILICGDLIDNSIVPVKQQRMEEELRKLQAPMGIYMAAGNHEYISRIEQCEEFLQKTPITLLRDSIAILPCGIQIVGRDDRHNHRRKSLEKLLDRVDNTKPIIVLDHQPYNLAEVDATGVDIQLSGHTHHGQVWPLSLLTDYIYEQSHGYRKWSNTHIYVSSGLSLWGPPFRIGTNSEMAIITIKSANNK